MQFSDWVALSALGVSLPSLAVTSRSAFLDRSRLTVTSEYHEASEFGPARIHIALVNKGRRPVILRLFGGRDTAGATGGTYLDHEAGGKRLAEHERHEFTVTKDDAVLFGPDEDLFFAELWVEDSLGRRHKVPKSKQHLARLWGKSAA